MEGAPSLGVEEALCKGGLHAASQLHSVASFSISHSLIIAKCTPLFGNSFSEHPDAVALVLLDGVSELKSVKHLF